MPQLKSEGIVLKTVNWKENSRIVTFFTESAGRQTIIDRGGRSLKAKRGRLLTFSRMEISYFKSEKSGTGYLAESEPLETFLFEKEGSLGRLTFASAALELLYYLLAEEEPQSNLYNLTIQFFRLTDSFPKVSLYPLFLAYFLRLLSFLGYRPNLSGCVGCGTDPMTLNDSGESTSTVFSPARGGVVCSACQTPGEYYIRLQPGRLEKMYLLQTTSLAESSTVRLKLKEAENMLELLCNLLKYQADTKELKSLKFLEKLKKTTL